MCALLFSDITPLSQCLEPSFTWGVLLRVLASLLAILLVRATVGRVTCRAVNTLPNTHCTLHVELLCAVSPDHQGGKWLLFVITFSAIIFSKISRKTYTSEHLGTGKSVKLTLIPFYPIMSLSCSVVFAHSMGVG